MDTLARTIAHWVAQVSFGDLPHYTLHEAKRRVLDSIGCALGAYRSAPATIAREVALSASDSGGAQVWGTHHRSRPELAAFANGAMVRYLDYNDTYLSLEPAHPSDNIPAAAAVAQAAGLRGADLILASVIGYEIQCRQCDAASLRAQGWDHVFYGALSTAALAGKLWDLNEEQIEHALGLAGVCNIATRQTRTGQISMWKACAFSNAARNGIFAADLARRGMTGPHEIYEGPKGIFHQLTGPFSLQLGADDFMIDRTYIKYWPAEYHAQSAIDAMLQLRPEIAGRAVRSILIESFEAAVSIIGSEPEKWRPTSRETADHSLPYCVAVALLDGDVTLESFAEARLADPRILELLDKTSIVEDSDLNDGYPEGIPNRLTVTLEDGTTLEKRVDFPRGHARNPMSDDEVAVKFRRLAEGVVTDATAREIIDRCMTLEQQKDLAPLFEFEVLA
ncbi:MAG: MmgE/PrpD family protein [FCB group bacterium]|jgi:2-methylcitrate dehydratase|nr:MmgE/PrpD family protein [FCB group bacterium]